MESWANLVACQAVLCSVYIYWIESLYSACFEHFSQIVPIYFKLAFATDVQI